MLSIEKCQRVLNRPGGRIYSLEEVQQLRSVLYRLAHVALEHEEEEAYETDDTLCARLDRRPSRALQPTGAA